MHWLFYNRNALCSDMNATVMSLGGMNDSQCNKMILVKHINSLIVLSPETVLKWVPARVRPAVSGIQTDSFLWGHLQPVLKLDSSSSAQLSSFKFSFQYLHVRVSAWSQSLSQQTVQSRDVQQLSQRLQRLPLHRKVRFRCPLHWQWLKHHFSWLQPEQTYLKSRDQDFVPPCLSSVWPLSVWTLYLSTLSVGWRNIRIIPLICH